MGHRHITANHVARVINRPSVPAGYRYRPKEIPHKFVCHACGRRFRSMPALMNHLNAKH